MATTRPSERKLKKTRLSELMSAELQLRSRSPEEVSAL
jgi:hypothetical protein